MKVERKGKKAAFNSLKQTAQREERTKGENTLKRLKDQQGQRQKKQGIKAKIEAKEAKRTDSQPALIDHRSPFILTLARFMCSVYRLPRLFLFPFIPSFPLNLTSHSSQLCPVPFHKLEYGGFFFCTPALYTNHHTNQPHISPSWPCPPPSLSPGCRLLQV